MIGSKRFKVILEELCMSATRDQRSSEMDMDTRQIDECIEQAFEAGWLSRDNYSSDETGEHTDIKRDLEEWKSQQKKKDG